MYKLKLLLKSRKQFKIIENTPKGHSELKHPRRRLFVKTVNDQEPLNPSTKKLCLRCLTRLWMHLCTPKLIYYKKIKTNIKTGTLQSAERLEAPWGLLSAKFKATANELHQK